MKNKTVKMILAVAVLVVCCGAYAGVKTYVSHQEEKESEETEEEKTTVFSASADDVQSLDFMVDDTETTFEKSDDTWIKKDEKDFPVNQSTLDSAASSITSIESDRVLEDVDDLAEYGLDSPSNTIKITTKSSDLENESDSSEEADTSDDSDNSEDDSSKDQTDETVTTTLYVGDENQSTSQYYVYKDNDKKTVYLIDSSCVEPFAKTLYDYAQGEDFPAISSTDTISKITVKGEKSYELSKDEDTSVWSVSGSGDTEKADSATVSSLVSSFGSMAYDSLVNYKCEDKSEYGLDNPYATITVDYQEEKETDNDDSDSDSDEQETTSDNNESTDDADGSDAGDTNKDIETSSDDAESDETVETDSEENADTVTDENTDSEDTEDEEPEMVDAQLVIKVGNTADDGKRYVMVNDSNEVYTMSEDTLSALTDKTEEDFWDMTVSYVSVNSLASLKLNYQGNDYKINVSRETSEDDDGNEKETVTYKLDGTETDSTNFTTFYNKLINMAAQKRLTDKFEPETDPELTATMTEEDGDSLEVKYYSYDTNYYAAVVDKKVYLVNKMNVKEMFSALDAVVTTEDKDSTNEAETTDSADMDEQGSDSTETVEATEMPEETVEDTSDNSEAVDADTTENDGTENVSE